MALDSENVYLLLGGNLGDRIKIINDAVRQIEIGIGEVTARSSVYETEAWGNTNQPGFLNVALEVKTILPPLAVLKKALEIEHNLGRVRLEKWGSRLIDIDLIFYGSQIIDIADVLQVPHPHMHERKFVLKPLAEIAPDLLHPVFNKSIATLLAGLSDHLAVSKI
ncbi:2-amino-4-hydroxy-6-hydroxymethyldihydropteridine diphosphokinase [Pedobacter metabolipauper]|uniref:2-amino-4-hydroxy-6-hydroxymethyldihydropteridine pyrophosphokinase n=1 Tax=Pedobacter metabolipauper TaxID=425513 RepID=A0A4R6SVF0_9SPHI|nr:2-amino-4-hydroxy-6-hydroxymethyldihydropteridine diphosphokinase [Pedobacter metabolipauper]TDQ08341.1 2-amino-4-hydroxy-6-hydroxymethyldihydropteridine diphosphokinase [Pedobacter metabolipauper]